MGFLDFLKAKPKSCQSCQKEYPNLHKYNPIYFENKETRQSPLLIPRLLCNDCFLRQVKEDILNYKDKIVFIEPQLPEGYSFRKFADDEGKGNKVDYTPLKTFLPQDNSTCNKCGQTARFTWVFGTVIKDSQFRGEPLKFKNKDECSEYKYLCAEHLMEEFSESIKDNELFFMEFWPIKGFGDGYCW